MLILLKSGPLLKLDLTGLRFVSGSSQKTKVMPPHDFTYGSFTTKIKELLSTTKKPLSDKPTKTV